MIKSIAKNKTVSRPRWLIIDDRVEIVLLAEKIFARFQDVVEVQCFDSPEDGFAAFMAEPAAFEFVITDLEMPEFDDPQLSRHHRALWPLLRVLLSTGSEILSEEEAEEKGFFIESHEPFPFTDLQAALEPAILKYSPQSTCRGGGLMLVCA